MQNPTAFTNSTAPPWPEQPLLTWITATVSEPVSLLPALPLPTVQSQQVARVLLSKISQIRSPSALNILIVYLECKGLLRIKARVLAKVCKALPLYIYSVYSSYPNLPPAPRINMPSRHPPSLDAVPNGPVLTPLSSFRSLIKGHMLREAS